LKPMDSGRQMKRKPAGKPSFSPPTVDNAFLESQRLTEGSSQSLTDAVAQARLLRRRASAIV
jgi:hypothetical protein